MVVSSAHHCPTIFMGRILYQPCQNNDELRASFLTLSSAKIIIAALNGPTNGNVTIWIRHLQHRQNGSAKECERKRPEAWRKRQEPQAKVLSIDVGGSMMRQQLQKTTNQNSHPALTTQLSGGVITLVANWHFHLLGPGLCAELVPPLTLLARAFN